MNGPAAIKFDIKDRLDVCLRLEIIAKKTYAEQWTQAISRNQKNASRFLRQNESAKKLNEMKPTAAKVVKKRKIDENNSNNASVPATAAVKKT